MTWAVTAMTVGKIGSSIIGGMSARKQAEAKRKALEAAKGELTKSYDTSRGYYQPYQQIGTAASNRLAELLGIGGNAGAQDYGYLNQEFTPDKLKFDPSYMFRLKEGLKATEGMAAARGGLLSGSTIKGTQKYAQGLASTEYGNAYDRYRQRQQDIYDRFSGQQAVGYKASNALADLSSGYGTNLANLAMGQGAVDAAATGAKYKMYGDIFNTGANALGDYFGGKTPKTVGTNPTGID